MLRTKAVGRKIYEDVNLILVDNNVLLVHVEALQKVPPPAHHLL